MTVSTMMNTTGTFSRTTKTPITSGAGAGGHTEADQSYAVDVRCRLSTPSGRDIEIAGRKEAVVTHALYWVPDPDVDPKTDDGFVLADGRTFKVRVPAMIPSRAVYQKALLEEYQSG